MHNDSAGYYRSVAQGFDRLAEEYDVHYAGNRSLDQMRRAALDTAVQCAQPGEWWLEVGCGTGRDAVALAARGVNILATDISPGMLARFKSRLDKARPAGTVLIRQLGTGELDRLFVEWRGRCDGALMLFGAINYEPNPRPVFQTVWRLLKPGGRIVAAVRNRFCLWEIAYHLVYRPSFRLAFRRLRRGGTPTEVGGNSVRMWVYTPAGFSRLARPWFQSESLQGLSVALPPYMVEKFHSRFPRGSRWLAGLETRVAGLPIFRLLGDHFLTVIKRNDTAEA